MKKNIVLLASYSRESQAKMAQYQKAARELGLGVRAYPDKHTIGVFPCTDFRAVEAAQMAWLHGIPGPNPMAVATATQKTLAYAFFAEQGFPTLWWQVPVRAEDLRYPMPRPVIVKPERGSGSFAEHPWAYKTFKNLRVFHKYLQDEDLLEPFLAYQNDPNSWYGRYLVMEYVDDSDVFINAAVGNAKALHSYEASSLRCSEGTLQGEWMLIGNRHRRQATIEKLAQALFDIGLRHSIIYIQCVEKDGQLCPIDINLRPGTMPDRAFDGLDLDFYTAALAYSLGLARTMKFIWPAPYTGIRRVCVPLEAGRRKAVFGPECVPVLDELSYDPDRPFDLGHAWPMFVLTGTNKRKCDALEEKLVREMTLLPLQAAA